MKARELIKLMTAELTEDQILTKMKSKLAKIKLPLETSFKGITPLQVAATRGHTKILGYLIETQHANPKAIHSNDKTALEDAIFNRKTDAALYLISKMKGFDSKLFHSMLLLAVHLQQLSIVKAILNQEPHLINYRTTELMKEALDQPSNDIAIFLLQQGAHRMILVHIPGSESPYSYALRRLNDEILTCMLEFGASPFHCDKNSTPTAVWEPLLSSTGTNNQKRTCANILFAAGAGLDIQTIPDEVLTLYGLNRKIVGEILIIGEQKQDNGVWQKKSISNISTLTACFTNQNWRFNGRQLMRAVLSFESPKPTHINALQALFQAKWDDQSLPQISIIKPAGLSNHLKAQLKKGISTLTLRELDLVLCEAAVSYRAAYSLFREMLNNISSKTDTFNQKQIIKQYFRSYSRLVEFLQHPDSTIISLGENMTLAQIMVEPNDMMTKMKVVMSSLEQQDDAFEKMLMVFNLFNDHLKSLLKKHEILLSPLLVKQLLYMLRFETTRLLANQYLNMRNTTLALHSAIEANRCINTILLDSSLKISIDECKYKCLLLLSAIYAAQGCFKEATKALQESNKFFQLSEITEDLFLETAECIRVSLSKTNITTLDLITFIEVCNIHCFNFLLEENSSPPLAELAIHFNNQYEELCYQYLTQTQAFFAEKLQSFGKLIIFSDSLVLMRTQDINPATLNLLNSRCDVQYFSDSNSIIFTRDLLFSHNSHQWLDEFINAITTIDSIQSSIHPIPDNKPAEKEPVSTSVLTESFATLSLPSSKTKIKTQPESHLVKCDSSNEKAAKHDKLNNYGFELFAEQSPAIPVGDKDLAHTSTFISVPRNANFAPLLSFNKLSKQCVRIDDKSNVMEVSIRLPTTTKILKATGSVQQETVTAQNQYRRLYLIKNIVTPSKVNHYGFKPLEGYTPPIPIVNNYIPDETLFITLPCNNPTFLPFFGLCYNKQTNNYHEVRGIAEKGLNQQGVKLSSKWVTGNNQQPTKIDIARMKVLGADGKGKLRAIGQVQQEIRTQNNRIRKLYVINEIEEKKKEKRNGVLKSR
ncbi:ankyrin repeat domain-containing protein [Candidatus Berkiella aquae]|uniref:Ankyrin repeat domain-containing protein n=1 Tax=Candidatus Berkiella aquae TaxID=295108 RepID=A0A0Q9YZF0_9GAMM|nr:ankyrin repeat domain-containing protein [Candidatus Berkiella aquae]MCS5711517.1 ankyrin repeat domain-containing protein [Candidatus Berkiella aquae]